MMCLCQRNSVSEKRENRSSSESKALLCHQVIHLRFSTKNKRKQSARIRDNQKILKVTQNAENAPLTCPGTACIAAARDTISSLCEERTEQAMAHREEFKLSEIRQLESAPGLAFKKMFHKMIPTSNTADFVWPRQHHS